jgi:hypothetical protein
MLLTQAFSCTGSSIEARVLEPGCVEIYRGVTRFSTLEGGEESGGCDDFYGRHGLTVPNTRDSKRTIYTIS